MLPIPASFANWPFHFSASGSHTSYIGHVVERVIEPNTSELWRVAVPQPHEDRWLTTAQLLKHIDIETRIAKDTSKPTRVIPVARPFSGFTPTIDNVHWTRDSAYVGHIVTVSLSNMTASWRAERDRVAAAAPTPKKSKGGKPPLFAVTIEAVFLGLHGAPVQCIGRCHHDSTQLVFFTDIRDVSEGSFTYVLPKAGWGRSGKTFNPNHSLGASGTTDYTDCSLNNPNFLATLNLFSGSMPSSPVEFYQTGLRLMKSKVPKNCRAIYREALLGVVGLLDAKPDSLAAWKLLLIFDGLILAPVDATDTTSSAIKRRVRWLRAGDWSNLLPELKFRTQRSSTNTSPLHSDPKLARALRASAVFKRTHSRSGAASALGAPLNPPPVPAGGLTTAFRKLNPQAGVDTFDAPGHPETLRRALAPPVDIAPPPITFTVQEVLKKVRRANKAAAGGPSGTDYMTLGTWFHEDDALSQALTRVLNLIAAGKVPEPIVQLLIAGRGICIPKDEKGGLRPIVVGSVLMRLVGSLAIQKESAAINKYFLQPRPLQFGVGVQGGCELMASAIESHLRVNPTSIVLSCDAANAFNSVCRSKLWDVLRAKFPSFYALVRMMYGSEASIIFSEEGVPSPSVVKNSVGTRQGCSLGSMIFALMIHPYLLQLAEEFPDVLVLAYADDVFLAGPPERTVACYKRWQELYGDELQGSLRDDKGKVYAQQPSPDAPPPPRSPPSWLLACRASTWMRRASKWQASRWCTMASACWARLWALTPLRSPSPGLEWRRWSRRSTRRPSCPSSNYNIASPLAPSSIASTTCFEISREETALSSKAPWCGMTQQSWMRRDASLASRCFHFWPSGWHHSLQATGVLDTAPGR